MKWIKLKSAVGEHKAGALIEVEEATADAYVKAGLADHAGSGPNQAIEAVGAEELKKALKQYNDGMAVVFKEAADEMRKNAKFPSIEAGAQEADRTKSMDDFVFQIARAANVNDLEGCRAAQERLTKAYGSKINKGQEESQGGSGGFWTVPTVYEKTILAAQGEDAVILPGVTNVPLGARAVEWPSLDQYQVPTKGNSAYYAGITVSRKGENTPRDLTQAAGTQVKLEANDLTAFAKYSRDVQQDSEGVVESQLTTLIGGALGFRRDWEHMWGDGVGKALGYLNCPAVIKKNRTTALTVTYADVALLVSLLMTASHKRAVWVAHPYLLNSFLTMQDPAGHYIYVPTYPGMNNGPAGYNPPPMLANIPVLFSEKAAAPGNYGDFTLCDRKAILSGMRGGIELAVSEHYLFNTDEIAIRVKVRDDAQPWLKKPITLADGAGTNTVSAFVGLNTKLS